jgi:hypothetical protein
VSSTGYVSYPQAQDFVRFITWLERLIIWNY